MIIISLSYRTISPYAGKRNHPSHSKLFCDDVLFKINRNKLPVIVGNLHHQGELCTPLPLDDQNRFHSAAI